MAHTIVFIGDSITDAGRRTDPDRQLGDGYVRLVAAELANRGDDRSIVNTGISGDRAVDLRDRSVYVGINDTWRRFDSDSPTSADEFAATYWTLLDDAQTRLAPRFILMEPFVVPVTNEQKHWGADDLDAKRAVVASLADEFGAAFVPLQSILDAAAAQNGGAAAIAADGVHPTSLGSSLIAGAWLAAEATL
jgi:acyl-CoA thioesterase-1